MSPGRARECLVLLPVRLWHLHRSGDGRSLSSITNRDGTSRHADRMSVDITLPRLTRTASDAGPAISFSAVSGAADASAATLLSITPVAERMTRSVCRWAS
jgi:hypothetical protein